MGLGGLNFGIPRLEELTGGDVPRGQTLLLSGPPFVGKEVLLARAVSTSLLAGTPVLYVTTSKPTEDFGRELLAIEQAHLGHMRSGSVKWVDLASTTMPQGNAYSGNVALLAATAPLEELLATMKMKAPSRGRFLLVVNSLSPLVQKHGVGPVQEFMRKLSAMVRERDGNGLISIERGTHTEQEYEAIVSVLHAVLSMKKEGTKTMLQVEGLEKAQSKEWVEYTIEGRILKLGAFSLERIR